MAKNESIIIVEGGRIGDAICHTPGFALLRHHKPDAQIDMIVNNVSTAEVYYHNPGIDHIYIAPPKKETKKIAKNYDYALAMSNTQEDILKYIKWLNIKTFYCSGHQEKHYSDVATYFIRSILKNYDHNFPLHYRVYPQVSENQQAIELLKSCGATLSNNEILIGCHFGCYKIAERALKFWKRKIWSHRAWPVENYRLLAKRLFEINPNIKLVLTGTKGENKIAKRIFKNMDNILFLAGKINVLEFAAAIKYFKIFISGDTGPMHLATTTTVPLVVLFGSTKPEIAGPKPIQPYHTIIERDNIAKITVDEVYNAIIKFL